jgi:hypothetical protein
MDNRRLYNWVEALSWWAVTLIVVYLLTNVG